MNPTKLAYIRRQSEHMYQVATKKVLGWTKSFEVIRLTILIGWFMLNSFVYLYYVNLSSTEGYFYGRAQEANDIAEFEYNITKLDIVDLESKLRDTLPETYAPQVTKLEY